MLFFIYQIEKDEDFIINSIRKELGNRKLNLLARRDDNRFTLKPSLCAIAWPISLVEAITNVTFPSNLLPFPFFFLRNQPNSAKRKSLFLCV